MLDLVILTPWFPNQPDGWPARYISDSALALARVGHKVRVGVLRGYVPPGMARWAPLEHQGQIDESAFQGIEAIRLARYFALPNGWMLSVKNRSIDRSVRGLLEGFVAERKPDAVLVHTETIATGAIQAAHELGIPAAVTLHGQNTNQAYLAAGCQKERFRAALSQADKLIVVGKPLVPYAIQLAAREDHIEVVWNGVEPPDRIRTISVPDTRPIELITVSNLQEGKGVDLLLAALECLDHEGLTNWRLRIIGDGPMRATIREQAAQAKFGDRVQFLGTLTNTEVFKELSIADVFVLPSYREAFGVAYLEAMACGLLTIGVRGQGPAQFISDQETGLLVEPRSVDAVVSALRTVLTGDRNGWRNIAAQGASYVRQEMTWDAHARQLTKLFHSIFAS